VRECRPTTDTQRVTAPRENLRPWWLVVIAFWRTIPVVIALAFGYAVGHPSLGAVIGLVFILSSFAFSRWVSASAERQHDDRFARALANYFVGLAALLVLVVIGWAVVERA